MRKLLFRSRSGEGYPMVIAVTLCLLMLFMVIAEYFRVNIIVQGVRDAVQQAVIATVNENWSGGHAPAHGPWQWGCCV